MGVVSPGGTVADVAAPGGGVLGMPPGGQWVVAPGGMEVALWGVRVGGVVKGGLAEGVGVMGGLGEDGGGVVGAVPGAAMPVIAAAPSNNPDSAAGRYLMMYS